MPYTVTDSLAELLPDLGRRTVGMGILNVTPDSFSDGAALSADERIARGLAMVAEGADILDIGGESTRPGSDGVSVEEELARVLPVIYGIRRRSAIPISVDTSKAEVARQALEVGGDMVNDVTALAGDPEMLAVVADAGCPVILMHMLGMPRTMQDDPQYEDVIGDISSFLRDRIRAALDAGIDERDIIIDPGIGFGKTVDHNLEIIRRLREFEALGRPILIGTSRKTFIGKILDLPVEDRLEGSLATVAASIMNGASIVRVHDVQPTVRVARMVDAVIQGVGG